MRTGVRGQGSGDRGQESTFGIRSLGCSALTHSHPGSAALLGTFLLLLASGCGQKDPTAALPSPDVLAVVDGTAITERTFCYWWEKQPMVDTPEVRQALLEKLIRRSSLAGAARAAGLADDPVVAEQVESLLISRLKETELQPKIAAITVSDADITSLYESRKHTRYTTPERCQLAVLWFATRGVEPLVARYTPRLAKAREQTLSPQNGIPASQGFGKLSIPNSEHAPSRYKGGIIGWLETARPIDPWRAAVLEIARDMTEPGQVSDVMAQKEGLFLVRLIARQPARIRDLAEVREAIVRELKTARRKTIEREFNERIQLTAQVRRFPEHLSTVTELPTQASASTEAARSRFAAQPNDEV
jgi:hypothetical protein